MCDTHGAFQIFVPIKHAVTPAAHNAHCTHDGHNYGLQKPNKKAGCV